MVGCWKSGRGMAHAITCLSEMSISHVNPTVRPTGDSLEANYSAFRIWVYRAELQKAAGRCEAALWATQIAAHLAWTNHPGVFHSPALEAVLEAVGARLPSGVGRFRGEVLHVMTEAYPTGGHTRLVKRWIEAAPSVRHSVVLTRQVTPLPDDLRLTVVQQGGQITDLLTENRSLYRRAGALRSAVTSHQLVVMHTHPSDAVAITALQRPIPGRVAFLNHADHVFWLGTRAADRYLSIRDAAVDLTAERRGIPRAIQRIVPIPLADARFPGQDPDRPTLRDAIGVHGKLQFS